MSATLRPMAPADVEAAGACARAAFDELDASLGERRPGSGGPAEQGRYLEIYRHLLGTDPQGCHVAVAGDQVVGVALSFVREDLWALSLLVVAPGAQGGGLGRRLLEVALEGAAGCTRAALSSSPSSVAMRRYVRAGFTPHPTLKATGVARSAGLVSVSGVRAGADAALADEVDAQVRGARRGSDHEVLARHAQAYTTDGPSGRGYAYLAADGRVVLAATSFASAQALLVTCLAESDGREVTVAQLTAEQAWALAPCLDAGLALRWSGPLMLRGMVPASPYLPSGLFL